MNLVSLMAQVLNENHKDGQFSIEHLAFFWSIFGWIKQCSKICSLKKQYPTLIFGDTIIQCNWNMMNLSGKKNLAWKRSRLFSCQRNISRYVPDEWRYKFWVWRRKIPNSKLARQTNCDCRLGSTQRVCRIISMRKANTSTNRFKTRTKPHGHNWCHPRPKRDPLSRSTKKGAKGRRKKASTPLSHYKTEWLYVGFKTSGISRAPCNMRTMVTCSVVDSKKIT